MDIFYFFPKPFLKYYVFPQHHILYDLDANVFLSCFVTISYCFIEFFFQVQIQNRNVAIIRFVL